MKKNRVWEIDFLRGISILIMIYYHIVFDLSFFFRYPISTDKGFNFIAGKIAIVFILVSGISSSFSKNNFLRGIKLFIISLILTFATYIISVFIFKTDTAIMFGILHLLAFCMIFSNVFLKIKPIFPLVTGILVIISGNLIKNIYVNLPFLFPLGLKTKEFSSLDYFPIFPWFGYYLVGIFIGRVFYKNKESLIKKPLKNNIINSIGKHSLLIYLIHQPIVFFILFILDFVIKKLNLL
jgi:uncharacterized membrane protein